METKTGTIENVDKKTAKNNNQYWVYTISGKNYSTFDAKIGLEFKQGTIVEYDIEKKGEFENLVAMRVGGAGAIASTDTALDKLKELGAEAKPDRADQVDRKAAITASLKFHELQGSSFTSDDVIIVAGRFEGYIQNGN